MAPLIGAKLVLPGPALAGGPMAELIATEGVTLMAGVPTIWRMLLDHLKATGQRLDAVDRVVIGGAAGSTAPLIASAAWVSMTDLFACGVTTWPTAPPASPAAAPTWCRRNSPIADAWREAREPP